MQPNLGDLPGSQPLLNSAHQNLWIAHNSFFDFKNQFQSLKKFIKALTPM
jgi:hypothetical protein